MRRKRLIDLTQDDPSRYPPHKPIDLCSSTDLLGLEELIGTHVPLFGFCAEEHGEAVVIMSADPASQLAVLQKQHEKLTEQLQDALKECMLKERIIASLL